MEIAEKYFPSVLELKETQDIRSVINEMAQIFESYGNGSSFLEHLPRLIKLREKLHEALKESIQYTIVSEAIDKAAVSKRAEGADTSIAEGPIQFYNALNYAIGEMSTMTNVKELCSKLRKFVNQMKAS